MENLQTENLNSKNEQQKSERLSENEAWLYQKHVTKKEGLGFSEQAKDEDSYAEADALLDELREKRIELEGMDLRNIDLKDFAQQDKLGEKLEKEVAHLAVNNEDAGVMQKIGEVMGAKGIRKIVMLLSLFSVLSAEGVEAASKKATGHHVEQNHKEKQAKTEKLEFEGVRVTFEFDSKGKPERCAFRSTKHYTEDEYRKMDVASNKMLVDEYMQIVSDRVLKRGGTMNIIQAELKSVRRDFLVGADLYHKLLQNNMKDEAKLVRNNILEKIVRTEASIGNKIFDRSELARILNSEK